MEVITSLQNNKIKELSKLNIKKYRDESKFFLVEGEHLVEEAYKKNQLQEVLITLDYKCNYDVNITYISEDVMKKLSMMKTPSKIIGVCKKFIPLNYGNRLILLDNLQDPGNLGTIIRSAASFNFDTVVLSETTVDLYNDKVIRSSEGMIFNIDIMKRNLIDLINELKENNYVIYGTDVNGGTILNETPFESKMAIVIGSEGSGVSEEIKRLLDSNIYIPMNKKCESLNASVAASIIMYEVSKVDYE